MVTRILVRADDRVAGVEYVGPDGQRVRIEAERVVLAATAVESARLLLLSACEGHPRGLGNRRGQVGKNLCFSTLGQVHGRLAYEDQADEARREALAATSPFVGRAVQDFYRADGVGFGKGGTFHLLWAHPNPIHAAEQLIRDKGGLVYGADLNRRLRERFVDGRSLEVECFGEWLPTEGCHVSLDDEAKDRWGLPAARITVAERHPSDLEASRHLTDKARALLAELGARDIEVETVGGETWVLQHGTCRMGTDPASSVTDVTGQVHDVQNLYVTCGGALPSSGAVPSTFTILANAFRVADGMAG